MNRRLVLVVDDFTDGRELARDVLAYAGYQVSEAATGHDALETARALLPGTIVLDLALPGIDGWEVARLLKSDSRTSGIRILALTAHAEVTALERARAAGCDLVLTKPCAPDDLIASVARLRDERETTA